MTTSTGVHKEATLAEDLESAPVEPQRMAYAICAQTLAGYLEHVSHIGAEAQHGERWPEIREALEKIRAAMLLAANPERKVGP